MDTNYEKIKVLVVDDSALIRSVIKGILRREPDFDVVATARDGQDALEKIEAFKPDIVTMDIEMPRMDGLTALKIIMERMPLPVLVLSSLTSENAEVTLKALDLGAVDFVCKDFQSDEGSIEDTLISKLKEIVRKRIPRVQSKEQVIVPRPPLIRLVPGAKPQPIAVLAIGVSTGGPKALQDVIPLLPADFPVPVLIVQHMPVQFTGPFAERMDAVSQLRVKEAATGDVLEPGMVYIGRGGVHLKVKRVKVAEVRIELDPDPADVLYHPSADIMFSSVVEAYHGRTLGLVMTGMGNDGTEGLRAIKVAGGRTMAQDEESCIVYGMPKCAVEAGVVDQVFPLSQLAREIVAAVAGGA